MIVAISIIGDKKMKFITDRVRVFVFGITVAIMGLYSPAKTIRSARTALVKSDY